jgi:hypothetical protein
MTLADEVIKYTYDKRCMMGYMTGRTAGDIRDTMIRAHRFVLDNRMSSFMADLSVSVYKTVDKARVLDSMRYSALLPHDVTWVEWNGRVFRDRIDQLEMSHTLTGEPLAPSSAVPFTWAMLMERHPRVPTAIKMTEFLSDELGGNPLPMPFANVWNIVDEPLPWKDACTMSGMISHGIIGYECPYIGVLLPKREGTPKHWWSEVSIGDRPKFTTSNMVVETAGVTRYALAFLAALSTMPASYHHVEPGKKYYVRGHYRKFVDHTEVRLNLPARANPFRVARKLIAKAHHRAHKVREHFRVYEREKDRGCDHLWGPVDDNNHSRCKRCTSWRTRIVEHVRGDASLGWVQHSYKVTHDAA